MGDTDDFLEEMLAKKRGDEPPPPPPPPPEPPDRFLSFVFGIAALLCLALAWRAETITMTATYWFGFFSAFAFMMYAIYNES